MTVKTSKRKQRARRGHCQQCGVPTDQAHTLCLKHQQQRDAKRGFRRFFKSVR